MQKEVERVIPQDRTLYLELAKLKPHDRKWLRQNLKQVERLLKKEMGAKRLEHVRAG